MFSQSSPHARYRLYTSAASYVPQLYAPDDAIERFEAEICRRFDVAGAVCVPRARTGLYLTLAEIMKGRRKVIMSPLTIVDVVNAVLLAGGIPVFCDICRSSCSIDPGQAESLIDDQTAAILITHLHGQTARAGVFRDMCARHGIRLIEDAAQAFGASEGKQHLGTIGDAGVYSFGFFKNLTTWRGGMVVSNDQELIKSIRSRIRKLSRFTRADLVTTAVSGLIVDLSTWPPFFSRVTYSILRRNIEWLDRRLDPERGARRLTTMPKSYFCQMRQSQAAMGLRQLSRVDADTNERQVRARRYNDGLDGICGIIKPERTDGHSNTYTYFPIQIADRKGLLRHARARKRDFAAQHLRNCADLPEFAELFRDCPNARRTASELVLLPTYPRYPLPEVELNIEVIREFVTDQI